MMDTTMALLAGLFITAAFYMMLSRALIRMMIGVVLLGNGINLVIFVGGRLTRATPPIVPEGLSVPQAIANPLAQALILTAIVIGFSMFAFLMVLTYRAYQETEADDTDHMNLSEPPGSPQPPREY